MHTTGTTTARAYSALVHHTMGALLRTLPQGEAASITLRAGLVVEAKVDARWNTRYTVRRDGVASRGISALIMALEAHWEAEHVARLTTQAKEVAQAAGRRAAQANDGQGDFTVEMSDGLRTVGTVRVRAHNSIEASTKAEAAWPGAMSVGARLCAPEWLADDIAAPEAVRIAQATTQAAADAWAAAEVAQLRSAAAGWHGLGLRDPLEWVYDDTQGGYVRRCDLYDSLAD